MASEHRFDLLVHLIDMVVLEAWREASQSGNGSGHPQGGSIPEI
jgi:hypothetical protein